MKTLYKIFVLAVIDFGLIWLWVYQMDPEPSVSIAIIVLVPFVFVLNLIIAGILFVVKKKTYSRVFLLNAVIASVIMYYLFGKGIDRHQNKVLERWTFQKADTTFSLTRWKKINEFRMTYSLSPGTSWGFLDGNYEKENGNWILKSDTIIMKIDNNHLIGFRNQTDTIKMKKVER